MSMTRSAFVALAVLICSSSSTLLADNGVSLSIQFEDEVAVIRADPEAPHELVVAAISAMQKAGIEKFALKVDDGKTQKAAIKTDLSIQLVDKAAEINASSDLPYSYIKHIVIELKTIGVRKIKFAPSQKATTN